MTKKELAAKLASSVDLTQGKALEVVNAIFDTKPGNGIIAIEMDAGRKVTLPGFGTFSTRRSKEREGRNPATGEKITISARTVPVFKAGKGLKDRVYN
ncbi:MAG: HU family DNA-binding protein [Myxococcales bacterium]|nr:HU family DNA-binding protein [Myxococcales bacterium]